jgi:hypothetical protein
MSSIASTYRLDLSRHLTAEHGLFNFRLRDVHQVHDREHRPGLDAPQLRHDHDRDGRGLRLPSFRVK